LTRNRGGRILNSLMDVSRRVLAQVGVVAALLLGVAASTAGATVRTHAAATTLKVSEATANVHWREGWLKPGANITFSGTVGAASTLKAVLRPLDRPGTVTAVASYDLANAGPFSERIKLPPRPLPGRYSLSVSGTSGMTQLAPVKVTVTIPAPPEGVLDRVEVGTSPNGPWQSYKGNQPPVVKGSYKELWMRFTFLSPPTGKQIELVWKLRWHTVVGKVYKRYKDVLETSVASATPLPSGHWAAVLKIDGRVSKKMDVVLT
jgi:hypothetical protein